MTKVKCDYEPCVQSKDGLCYAEEIDMMILDVPYKGYAAACMGKLSSEVIESVVAQPLAPPVAKVPVVWYVDGSGKGRITCVNQAKTKLLDHYTRATTNNEAEWEAVLAALGYVGESCQVEIRTDSNDVVNWMSGSFKTRDPRMKAYKDRVEFMIKQKRLKVTFTWVSREENLAGLFMEGHLKIDGSN